MIDYWTAFAKTGDPNRAGGPVWPSFSPHRPSVLSLAPDNIIVVDLATEHHCTFWQTRS
jgi:para-nitrobenzyl esterase